MLAHLLVPFTRHYGLDSLQVQQHGGLLELFFEFIAVPAACSECQRVKRLVLRKQGGAQGVQLTQSGTCRARAGTRREPLSPLAGWNSRVVL